MVEIFKSDEMIKEYNQYDFILPDLEFRKVIFEDDDLGTAEIFTSEVGHSVTFSEKSLAMFAKGTHSDDMKEWDAEKQKTYRLKMLLTMAGLIDTLGYDTVERNNLLQRLMMEHKGKWIRKAIHENGFRFVVIPENNILQMYITIDNED